MSESPEAVDISLSYALFRVARQLLADGATNKQIGERLSVSEETVKAHVKHLMKVSNTATRTEFVVMVLRGRIRLHLGSRTSVMGVKEVA